MTYNRKTELDNYFYYATDGYRWSDVRKFRGVRLSDVTCKERGCDYKPQTWCADPKRAYRRHLKERHPVEFYRTTKKPFIIQEEPDIEPDMDALWMELAGV